MVPDRGIDGQSGQEGANDARQIDEICEHAGHHHDAKHYDKIGLFVIAHFAEHPRAGAAHSDQDQWNLTARTIDRCTSCAWIASNAIPSIALKHEMESSM